MRLSRQSIMHVQWINAQGEQAAGSNLIACQQAVAAAAAHNRLVNTCCAQAEMRHAREMGLSAYCQMSYLLLPLKASTSALRCAKSPFCLTRSQHVRSCRQYTMWVRCCGL